MRSSVLWSSIIALSESTECSSSDVAVRKEILRFCREIVRSGFLLDEMRRGYSSYRAFDYDSWVETKKSLLRIETMLKAALSKLEEAFLASGEDDAGRTLIASMKAFSGLLLVRKIRSDVKSTFKEGVWSNRFKGLYEIAFYDEDGCLVCLASNVKEAAVSLGIPIGSMATIISDVFPGKPGEGKRRIRHGQRKLTVYFIV